MLNNSNKPSVGDKSSIPEKAVPGKENFHVDGRINDELALSYNNHGILTEAYGLNFLQTDLMVIQAYQLLCVLGVCVSYYFLIRIHGVTLPHCSMDVAINIGYQQIRILLYREVYIQFIKVNKIEEAVVPIIQQFNMYQPRITKSKFRSRLLSEPKDPFISLDVSRNDSFDGFSPNASKHRNSLNIFQAELNGYLSLQKNNHSKILKNQRKQGQIAYLRNVHEAEISQLKNGIDALKTRVNAYKKHGEISTAISLILAKRANEKNVSFPAIIPPPPPPMPYMQFPPPMMPYPFYPQSRRQQSSEQSDDSRPKPKKINRKDLKEKKKMKKLDREKNRARLTRIMKKAFRAVAYIVYLKKLVKSIIAKRKTIFSKFWPDNFQKSTNGMRKWFSGSCKNFFLQMVKKSEVELPIQGDQSQNIINQKKKAIKTLIDILIQCLDNLTQDAIFQEVSQIVHIFCKHGGYIENGVLTPEQLETVCISETNKYLRLDKNLQKSQIINFLFIKLVIFNMLLQPWKYNEKAFNINENKQAYENFYYIASVFYQIILHIQDKLLDSQHASSIEVGNWRKLKAQMKIKCSPSLCHLDSNHEDGQIISGLINENVILDVFPINFWSEQINTIEAIVQKMHYKLRKVHAKFVNQIYEYKDLTRFSN